MNRTNCGCAPYKPNTNRGAFLQELYDTCDCVLPCESCECVEQTGTCPPPPPCKPVQRMKCCVEKPKKGFWQLLFGGKKCCPSSKKKQDKKRRPVTTLTCEPLPNVDNELCEDNVGSQRAAGKLNPQACPRKGCFPTPKSICGCHFYFNIENRTRRHVMAVGTNNQQISENNETPFEYGYDINEEPERDNLATNIGRGGNPRVNQRTNPIHQSSPTEKRSEGNKNMSTNNKRHSAIEGRKRSSVAFHPYNGQTRRSTGASFNGQRRSSLCNRKRKSNSSNSPTSDETESLSKNSVHIGLTFTKEETKYFVPSNDTCLPLQPEQNNSGDCKISQSDDSKENSEQVLTVEIHNSCLKVSQNTDERELNDHEGLQSNHNRTNAVPQSESLSRELIPMMKRRGTIDETRRIRRSLSENEHIENIDNNHRQHNKNRPSIPSQKRSKTTLDRRVSEILKKLNEIEHKISIIEKKGQDSKKIRVDFDGAKSTVSLHLKDPTTKKCDSGNSYNTNSKRGSGNTVIEIRHTQSKSCSPARRSFQENELHSSQSLDACDKNQPSSHKIVIKLPKISAKTQCFVLPDKKNNKDNENCKQVNSWTDISDELKCSPLNVPKQCYCYECVQKRVRCL